MPVPPTSISAATMTSQAMPIEIRMPVRMVGAAAGRMMVKARRSGPTSSVFATLSHSVRTAATPNAVLIMLGVVGLVLLCILALIMSAHRSGVLERLLNWMGRVPLLRRLAARLEPKRTMLVELDQQITEFYHRQPRRFVQAILLEYLSRCIFMVEIVLIVASLGYRLSYLRAFTIGGLEALVGNLLFLVPFELGAREGSYFALFALFGMDPQLGLYTSIVSRVRDLVWIGLGLLLMLPTAERQPAV